MGKYPSIPSRDPRTVASGSRARLRFARLGLLGAFVASGLTLSSSPVLAECVNQQNRFPPFTEVAPTAKRIVVGTVVGAVYGGGAWSSSFYLRVDEVLRGSAPSEITLTHVRSGLPLIGFQACRRDFAISAADGDVIAVAFDGRLSEYPGRKVTTAAWIVGKPPSISMHGVERMTLAEVRHAAGLPETSTAAASEGAGTEARGILLAAPIVGLIAAAALARRRRGRSEPGIA